MAGWSEFEQIAVPRLRPFLEASVETGNPLVGYYNGHSLGFD